MEEDNLDIEIWLKRFKQSWIDKDIKTILDLFSEDVEYWETPFKKLNFQDIKKQWEEIKLQTNIGIDLRMFNKEKNNFTVIWKLNFQDKSDAENFYEGVYLISLNHQGKCNYFFQCCEEH
ncbi:MAG: hypothetical protein ACOYT4_04470 [Nanoarchaeota archaeon]